MIDYSQYALWNFCPWAWYERYVRQYVRRWEGQRSDALCLGSLVHNILDNVSRKGKPEIDTSVLIENSPTPETVMLAEQLVYGYVKRYPRIEWPIEVTEAPLRFPLAEDFEGLAKLDGYFYVPEDTAVPSGIEGMTLTLARGWWAQEYKTKAASRPRPEWIREWQTKRQCDFQMLALKHHLDSGQEESYLGIDCVQGVLICVLEKPREYTPKRKCVACKETWELASFRPSSEGYCCPSCGKEQHLSPYIPKVPKTCDYFRITATRTPDQLAVAREEILQIAIHMEDMRSFGRLWREPNRDNCVNNVHRTQCEYMEPHTYGPEVTEDRRFHQIDTSAYMGVIV